MVLQSDRFLVVCTAFWIWGCEGEILALLVKGAGPCSWSDRMLHSLWPCVRSTPVFKFLSSLPGVPISFHEWERWAWGPCGRLSLTCLQWTKCCPCLFFNSSNLCSPPAVCQFSQHTKVWDKDDQGPIPKEKISSLWAESMVTMKTCFKWG